MLNSCTVNSLEGYARAVSITNFVIHTTSSDRGVDLILDLSPAMAEQLSRSELDYPFKLLEYFNGFRVSKVSIFVGYFVKKHKLCYHAEDGIKQPRNV